MSSGLRRFFAGPGAWCAVIAALAGSSAAQQQLGGIQGTIIDQTHAVLPGATMTITNMDTGATRTTMSNETGVYRVPSLDPGRYAVKAELQGFRTAVQTDLTLAVGATLGVNFTLNAGNVSETIQVTGVLPDIQTEKAEISAVVEQKKIEDLPLVGRNVLSLSALQPGMNGIPGTQDFLVPEQGMGLNANGVRDSANNASVDGASINNGPWGGTFLVVPNVEAVQEFQVIANNPSAEYGRNSGAMVSVITKGGTNTLHGSVLEYHRDNDLRARGLFEAQKASFRRNDFGGSVGGPIKKDSTFFFFSYEGVREQLPNSFSTTAETRQLVDWMTATHPKSIATYLLTKYPAPSYPTTGLQYLGIGPGIPDIGTINVTTNGQRNGDQFNGRFDQVLRQGRDRLRGTYYLEGSNNPFVYTRSPFDHSYPFRDQLLNLAYTMVISARTLNEGSFGYLRQDGHADDPTPDAPTIAFNNGEIPSFGVDFWHPIQFSQNNFQLKDTLTLNRGTHSFRTGGEARLGRDGATLHHWQRPNYRFQESSIAAELLDFLNDSPYQEERAVDPLTGQPTDAYGKYITNEWSLFLQDNWKVRSNLTLNLGLRYDNFGNPQKDQIPFNGIILGPGSTLQQQIATAKIGAVNQLYQTDWKDFAPRLGVTWDPSSSGALVFRAGGGTSYNRINNTVFSDERLNPPQFAHAVANVLNGVPIVYSLGPTYAPNLALGRGLDANGGLIGARVALRVVDPNVITPRYYNWFAGVQREIPGHFLVEANYSGSAGRHLLSADGPTSEDWNRFSGDLLADGRQHRLNPSFDSVNFNQSRIASNYEGMSLQVLRRYSKGFSVQASYTYGVAKDTPATAMIVERPDLDYGYAGFDIRHKVAVNAIFEIPYSPSSPILKEVLGGWQANGIAILQSGSPFTVTCTRAYPACDFYADGVHPGDRVNLPSFGTNLGHPSEQQWLTGVFKAADFTLPAPFAIPTELRNAFRGPAFKNIDFSLFKNFGLPGVAGGESKLQVRLETFNVFNWVNLNNPSGVINSTTFGRVTSARTGTGGPRVIQLALKYIF